MTKLPLLYGHRLQNGTTAAVGRDRSDGQNVPVSGRNNFSTKGTLVSILIVQNTSILLAVASAALTPSKRTAKKKCQHSHVRSSSVKTKRILLVVYTSLDPKIRETSGVELLNKHGVACANIQKSAAL